jgi:hypothetical protein
MRKKSKYNNFLEEGDEDPISSVANLFDVAMVFSIALILALMNTAHVREMLVSEDYIVVKNPGKDDMEILKKEGVKLEKYKMSQDNMAGEGQKLGICYRLDNGEVVYIPENLEKTP